MDVGGCDVGVNVGVGVDSLGKRSLERVMQASLSVILRRSGVMEAACEMMGFGVFWFAWVDG